MAVRSPADEPARAGRARYRFGFVLSVGAGNLTRYLTLRKYAERDLDVECVWAPNPGGHDRAGGRWLPRSLRARAAGMRHATPVLRRLAFLEAVMFHAFEPYLYATLRSLLARRPALVWSRDDPPTTDPSFWRENGLRRRPAWRARARFMVDRWCARHTALCAPFSRWAGEALIARCGVPATRVHAIPVGVDLERWPYARPKAHDAPRPARILFVVGDLVRKGGDVLIDVFARRLSGDAELHLVTRHPPRRLPPNVFVHTGLAADIPQPAPPRPPPTEGALAFDVPD